MRLINIPDKYLIDYMSATCSEIFKENKKGGKKHLAQISTDIFFTPSLVHIEWVPLLLTKVS